MRNWLIVFCLQFFLGKEKLFLALGKIFLYDWLKIFPGEEFLLIFSNCFLKLFFYLCRWYLGILIVFSTRSHASFLIV